MNNNIVKATKNGFLGKCPRCANAKLFARFLKTHNKCKKCKLEFHHHRADDFPAYLVVFIVGHIVVGMVLHTEVYWDISTATHLMIWIPTSVILSLALLQPVKGAVIGMQYGLKMHGFADVK